MPEAPILGSINMVADLSAASDFEKKHTPHIEVSSETGITLVSITVGWDVPHPNQPDHYITWIEIFAGEAPVARFELSPVVTAPTVSIVVDLDPGTVLRAVQHCNLHGLWAAEVTL